MKFYYDGYRLLNEEEFLKESLKYINKEMANEDIEYETQLRLNRDYTVYGILNLNLTQEEQSKMLKEYKLKTIVELKKNHFKDFSDLFIVYNIDFETKTGKVLSEYCSE